MIHEPLKKRDVSIVMREMRNVVYEQRKCARPLALSCWNNFDCGKIKRN